MAQLSAAHRKYVLIETLVSMGFNIAMSIPFALLTAHGAPSVPLWGLGMAVDLIPTVFMVTLMTALVVTFIGRKRVRAGGVGALGQGDGGWVERAPQHVLLRALTCAIVCVAVVVPISIVGLMVLGIHSMQTHTFIAFKAVYSAVLAILITPPIARAALCSKATAAA